LEPQGQSDPRDPRVLISAGCRRDVISGSAVPSRPVSWYGLTSWKRPMGWSVGS